METPKCTFPKHGMTSKKWLKALHRSLQDLRGIIKLFENSIILLAGDFMKTLPAISLTTPADRINACLKYSTFSRHVDNDYKYVCAAAKRSISRHILTSIAGNWEWQSAG